MHALALLNDTTYVEAARVLAERALQRAESPAARLEYILVGRWPGLRRTKKRKFY